MSGEPVQAPPADGAVPNPLPNTESNVRIRPQLRHYMMLNAAAWVFLAFQAAVLIYFLETSRLVYLLTFFLAAGFAGVTTFDYFWLKFFK